MKHDELKLRKDVAFINRSKDLAFLKGYLSERPESIIFLHGPKSSGKTTLLYKFLDTIQTEQQLEVKFLNLREMVTEFSDTGNEAYRDFLFAFFDVKDKLGRLGKITGINVGVFKIDSEIEGGMLRGRVDPFKVMKKEFISLNKKGKKPILIIDELQALDKIYMDNGRDRRLIIEIFNFFVAMTKESHLAHIIIASSDGYFLNTVFNDSRLKKTSRFYKVDYLGKEDVMEWLLNLEKYSKITAYTLSREEAEKIWDTVGGSMWEIQDILSQRFDNSCDDVLKNYKEKMLGMITYYITEKDRKKKEKILKHYVNNSRLSARDTSEEDQELLKDMVKNNILYFDPTEAIYYPQGNSYHWGIRLYFES